MIELHGSLDLCEWRKDVDGQEIDGSSSGGVRIDESPFGVELEDEEDGVNGNAGDMFLEFNAKLSEGGNIFDRGDLLEANDGGCSLELGSGSLDESRVEFALIRGGEAKTLCFGDDLHDGRFEFDVGAFGKKEVSDEVVVGTRGGGRSREERCSSGLVEHLRDRGCACCYWLFRSQVGLREQLSGWRWRLVQFPFRWQQW